MAIEYLSLYRKQYERLSGNLDTLEAIFQLHQEWDVPEEQTQADILAALRGDVMAVRFELDPEVRTSLMQAFLLYGVCKTRIDRDQQDNMPLMLDRYIQKPSVTGLNHTILAPFDPQVSEHLEMMGPLSAGLITTEMLDFNIRPSKFELPVYIAHYVNAISQKPEFAIGNDYLNAFPTAISSKEFQIYLEANPMDVALQYMPRALKEAGMKIEDILATFWNNSIRQFLKLPGQLREENHLLPQSFLPLVIDNEVRKKMEIEPIYIGVEDMSSFPDLSALLSYYETTVSFNPESKKLTLRAIDNEDQSEISFTINLTEEDYDIEIGFGTPYSAVYQSERMKRLSKFQADVKYNEVKFCVQCMRWLARNLPEGVEVDTKKLK